MGNPRAEALDVLGGDYEARVLEPSPPAVNEPPFTDDPVAPGEVPEGRRLVSPVSQRGDVTWDELAAADPELAAFASERWLGAWKRLEPLPDSFGPTRAALHKYAEKVVAVERKPPDEIALRYTRGGFGTPFYSDHGGKDCQLRVEHGILVHQIGEQEQSGSLKGVDPTSATVLGDLYGFGCSVLEELRAEYADLEPSLVQLWPEHFDIAFELGGEADGARANYGLSPGDDDHEEPYLYVGPWDPERAGGDLWNATSFTGAELGYAELLAADDQRGAALAFMRERVRDLAGL